MKTIRIEQARQFAQRALSGNIKNITKEDYQLFLISKFILLKESIIKNDINHNIYFDCQNNFAYLPIIIFIAKKLPLNKINGIDISKVILTPSDIKNDEFKKYIWIFNKLRDCLGHGKYELNSDNNEIILRNPPYMNNIVVHIELLELFSHIVETENQNKLMDAYFESMKKIEEYALVKGYAKVFNKYYFDYQNDKFKKDYINYYNYKINYNYDKPNYKSKKSESNRNPLTIEEARTLLIRMTEKVKSSSKFSKQEKGKILNKIYKLLDGLKKSKNDKKYNEKFVSVVVEIGELVEIHSKPIDFISLCATYNYANQVLSNKAESIKDNKIPPSRLGYLRMSKLKPQYVRKQNNIFENDPNSRISAKIQMIERNTKKYIADTKKMLADYKMTPVEYKKVSIINALYKFYESRIKDLGDKNKEIILSLRNAIEHGNIKDDYGDVYIYDQSNHTNDDTINFECHCQVSDLYETIEDIDLGRGKKDFTMADFLNEMKYILTAETYQDLENVIKEVNMLKLISVLKQAKSK